MGTQTNSKQIGTQVLLGLFCPFWLRSSQAKELIVSEFPILSFLLPQKDSAWSDLGQLQLPLGKADMKTWQHLPGGVGKEPPQKGKGWQAVLGLCSSYFDVSGSCLGRSIRASLPILCLVLCELRIYSFPGRVSIACIVFSAKVGT